MAAATPVVRWNGRFGRYDLQVYDLRTTRWNAVGGVYVFAKIVYDVWQPVYIGMCSSFFDRLCAQHHKWTSIVLHRATHVHAMRIDDETQRRAVEADLLAAWWTPCNEVLN